MLKIMAIVLYVALVYGLKATSLDYEEKYRRITEDMAKLSRKAFLRREDAIEMAIWCNAAFWLTLLPATYVISTPAYSTTRYDWLLFWGLKAWIWVGAALSAAPFVKGTRYVLFVRSGYRKELAAIVAEDRKHDSDELQ